jgi:F-box domain
VADARKARHAAALATVKAEAAASAARAAVDAALADGRVVSAAHLLDLNLDCLGAILSHLPPREALSASHTCTTLRSALFRGGLPGPLAAACCMQWTPFRDLPAVAADASRALDGMEPALGALRLDFRFHGFGESHARVLARAFDKAPRATRIDVTLALFDDMFRYDIGRLVDVLSSPDRAFAAPPRVRVEECGLDSTDALRRLARAGVCVMSIRQVDDSLENFIDRTAANAASTLTQLQTNTEGTFDLTTRFPALRRLKLDVYVPENFTIDTPSLTALAPLLKEIKLSVYSDQADSEPPKHGFGFEPRRFARFVDAIKGVTRFYGWMDAMLSQNENENLGQLTALRTLRDLEISGHRTWAVLVPPSPGHSRDPVAEDAITNLPPLAPGLTRLAFSQATRVAFVHPLPGLRVLDCRELDEQLSFKSFYWDEEGRAQTLFDGVLRVPLSIPSAAIAPNLHTLLIGYVTHTRIWDAKTGHGSLCELPRGHFDLWTLVAARTALRVVVIKHARLLCSAPDGFETTTAGFAALLAREANDLVSIHTHRCEIEDGHGPAVENFLRALQERGGRVCRAGVKCMFCMLHDGMDFWPPPKWERRW